MMMLDDGYVAIWSTELNETGCDRYQNHYNSQIQWIRSSNFYLGVLSRDDDDDDDGDIDDDDDNDDDDDEWWWWYNLK